MIGYYVVVELNSGWPAKDGRVCCEGLVASSEER